MIERIETEITVPCLTHTSHNSFIINCGSFYSAEAHRLMTKDAQVDITPQQWEGSVSQGFKQWLSDKPPKPKKDKPTKKKAQAQGQEVIAPARFWNNTSLIDPSLM